jgi:hypothetical protein
MEAPLTVFLIQLFSLVDGVGMIYSAISMLCHSMAPQCELRLKPRRQTMLRFRNAVLCSSNQLCHLAVLHVVIPFHAARGSSFVITHFLLSLQVPKRPCNRRRLPLDPPLQFGPFASPIPFRSFTCQSTYFALSISRGAASLPETVRKFAQADFAAAGSSSEESGTLVLSKLDSSSPFPTKDNQWQTDDQIQCMRANRP